MVVVPAALLNCALLAGTATSIPPLTRRRPTARRALVLLGVVGLAAAIPVLTVDLGPTALDGWGWADLVLRVAWMLAVLIGLTAMFAPGARRYFPLPPLVHPST